MTFNPRIYLEDKFLFQSEYRQAYKDDNMLISDFSLNHNGDNRSTHLFANLDGKLNETTDYEIQFQNVSNDNYLKLYNLGLTSPIIGSESSLKSYLDINKHVENEMRKTLKEIQSGQFHKEWQKEAEDGFPTLSKLRKEEIKSRQRKLKLESKARKMAAWRASKRKAYFRQRLTSIWRRVFGGTEGS